jgi:hypothetical protein
MSMSMSMLLSILMLQTLVPLAAIAIVSARAAALLHVSLCHDVCYKTNLQTVRRLPRGLVRRVFGSRSLGMSLHLSDAGGSNGFIGTFCAGGKTPFREQGSQYGKIFRAKR